MNLKSAKVYNDGSHFIAIPSDAFPHRSRKLSRQNLCLKKDELPRSDSPPETTKERFETAYISSGVSGKIELENKSDISAKEVIQIYFDNGKIKKLVYFDKISLLPKEKRTVEFEIDNFEFASYDGVKYSLLNESGKLILARNAEEDIFYREIRVIPEKKQKITKDSLIENVYENYGLEVVKKYFNKPLGLALYGDPERVFEYNEECFLKDDFERSVILMMPLKNLTGFSLGQYTDADLTRDIKEINLLKQYSL